VNAGGTVRWLNLPLLLSENTGFQTSDAALELAVLGGVDEGVDAAVGEHQNHGEVVEPAFISVDDIKKTRSRELVVGSLISSDVAPK